MGYSIEQDEDQDDFTQEVQDVSEDSVLADLKAEVESIDFKVKWYPSPLNPNIELGFNVNIDFDILRQWFKSATDRRKKELKTLVLANIIFSNQTYGLRIKGNELTKNGDRLTLHSSEVQRMFDAVTPVELVKRILKSEGYVITLMSEVINDAGYGNIDMEGTEDGGPLGR